MFNMKPSRAATPAGKFADRGKWTEDKVQTWLKGRTEKQASFAYHRFPDARAARNALAAQPSDWLTSMLTASGINFVTLLEAKETAEMRRLPKGKIGQYGKLFMFHLTGMPVRVLVHRSAFNDWVYFTEVDLFSHGDVVPTSFPFAGKPTFATAAEALEEIYQP